MNGAMTATNGGGRDHLTSNARSRRSNVKNGRPEGFDDSKVYEIVSDSADSRAARSAMRKKRIRRARKRKSKSNNAALCCLSVGIFVTYALICVGESSRRTSSQLDVAFDLIDDYYELQKSYSKTLLGRTARG